jgi:hypothetical protein
MKGLNLVLLLFPVKEPDSFSGKEPDSFSRQRTGFVNRMYLVPLENSAQCRATQQVLYELFTFITHYVVHFLPVLDFRAALNP